MVMLIEVPENAIDPWEIELQPGIGVGLSVGVGLLVGVLVTVGVRDGVRLSVAVGLSVGVGVSVRVGVRDGVFVNSGVFVGVLVRVLVGDAVEDGVNVREGVGVLRSGVFVTAIVILTRMVRALAASIGSPLATERSINGTNLGMTGKKLPFIVTWIRFVLLGEKLVSETSGLAQ